MIAGHFGFAAAVKAKAPSVPLWTLMLACQWLDVLFVPLLLAGVERLEPLAGTKPGTYGAAVIHADYTHSLAGGLALSAVFGAVAAIRYGGTSGLVLAMVAFSHWVLDLPMHRADMPILPGAAGNLPRLGLGLWRFPVASALLELAIVVIGAALYWRAARRLGGAGAPQAGRANLCGALVLLAGLLTLALNVLGM
ncbi:MAG TPA: hypothetical protein VEK07_23630 [Polyangiaceae bacterium]|nr:hypothetical protein [Polyangiaceae bacterium]